MKRRQKTQDSGSAPHGGGTATLDRDALPIVAGGDGAQRPRLGQVLLDQNLVSPDALSTALDLQQASGRRLGAWRGEDPHHATDTSGVAVGTGSVSALQVERRDQVAVDDATAGRDRRVGLVERARRSSEEHDTPAARAR